MNLLLPYHVTVSSGRVPGVIGYYPLSLPLGTVAYQKLWRAVKLRLQNMNGVVKYVIKRDETLGRSGI